MPVNQKALVIVVSQSGETADTLAALRLAKEKGITTMAVVNVVGSSIAREADKVFYTLAGPEISVATTKAYSAQLAAVYCLAVQFAKVREKITEEQYSYYISELLTLPEKMQKVLEDKERIQWFAAKYANAHDVFFVGRGIDYVNNIIWLSKGLARDETNGHIDNVMSVVRPHEICLAWTDNPKSQNYRRVREIEREITESYKCIIHKIPLPAAQYMVKEEAEGLEKRENSLERKEGDILPASYLNYYYVNNAVIIPAFGCKEDAKVFKKFCEIFPDRKVIQIYSREPLLGGGGIHCILHEIPER